MRPSPPSQDHTLLLLSLGAILLSLLGYACLLLARPEALAAEPDSPLATSIQTALLALGAAALLSVLLVGLAWAAVRRAAHDRRQAAARETSRLEAEINVRLKPLQTQLEQARTELEQARAEIDRLKTILDGLSDGILYADDGARIVNRALAQITGYGRDDLLRVPQDGLPEALAAFYRSVTDLAAKDRQGWLKIRRQDGSELDARVVSTPLNGSGGLLTIIRDSTREARFETSKQRFVSNAAHQLRTPIANLKTRLYLLRKQPEKLDEHLGVLDQVVQRLNELIEEMFDFSQFERGSVLLDRQDVVLQELAQEVIASYRARAEHRSIALECELPETPLTVYADPRRLSQVLTNLISNALNHTRDGGRVLVRLQADPPPADPDAPRYATLQVQDNGVGLAEDLLAQVFHPFAIPKHGDIGGTALGLTISKEIIELHGGEITAHSELGKGTLFSIRLELAAPAV